MPIISKTDSHRLKKTITGIETATPSVDYLQSKIDVLADAFIHDFETIASNYLRVNQSFVNMYYDDFTSISKTGTGYESKVSVDTYKMIPGSGEWRSKAWTASQVVTVIKMIWKANADSGVFDCDIEVSCDNGLSWTPISVAGDMTYFDKEISVIGAGSQVITRVLNGTNGYLQRYVLIVK